MSHRRIFIVVVMVVILLTRCTSLASNRETQVAAKDGSQYYDSVKGSSNLSESEIKTLRSLRQLDDYPLYRMDYSAPYGQAQDPGLRTSWNPDTVISWGCSLFTALGDPEKLLWQAILHSDDPVFFIENKLLYLEEIHTPESLTEFQVRVVAANQDSGRPLETPTYQLALSEAPAPTLTLAAYGYMAELGRQAALRLAYDDEIFCELIVPTRLSPVEIRPILESARRTGRLLVLEEGNLSFGWGAEILARVLEGSGGRRLQAGRVAARETPIPASQPLEDATLPGLEEVLARAREVGKGPY